jgi:hypothetical protein
MVLVHSKHKLLYFVEKAEKPGDFLCRKPPQKYGNLLTNIIGGGYNESEQRFALRPEGRKCERGKTSKTMWRF